MTRHQKQFHQKLEITKQGIIKISRKTMINWAEF